METASDYLDDVIEGSRAVDLDVVRAIVDLLVEAYRDGRHVFLLGNGGSASIATHMAQDLSKGTAPDLEKRSVRALALTENVSHMTALANDVGYDRVFDLQLRVYAEPGDVLIAISGSGNSANVVRALEYARGHGLTIVGLSGFEGGRLREMSDLSVHVPVADWGKVEAVHGIVHHMIVELLRERLAAEEAGAGDAGLIAGDGAP